MFAKLNVKYNQWVMYRWRYSGMRGKLSEVWWWNHSVISMIAQFAIDVPEYQRHCWVEQCLAAALVPFREAEQ